MLFIQFLCPSQKKKTEYCVLHLWCFLGSIVGFWLLRFNGSGRWWWIEPGLCQFRLLDRWYSVSCLGEEHQMSTVPNAFCVWCYCTSCVFLGGICSHENKSYKQNICHGSGFSTVCLRVISRCKHDFGASNCCFPKTLLSWHNPSSLVGSGWHYLALQSFHSVAFLLMFAALETQPAAIEMSEDRCLSDTLGMQAWCMIYDDVIMYGFYMVLCISADCMYSYIVFALYCIVNPRNIESHKVVGF